MEKCPKPSTTFFQADANTFREIVQRLTGASDQDRDPPTATPSPSPSTDANEELISALKVSGVRRSTFKLYERRERPRPKLQIVKPGSLFRPDRPVRSPSRPGFQATETETFSSHSSPVTSTTAISTSPAVLSPSTPTPTPGFITCPLNTPTQNFSNFSIFDKDNSDSLGVNCEEEERAIKERRFYLHPSPRSRPANAEPELLTLFPVISPKSSTHKS